MLMTEYRDLATMEANQDKADAISAQLVGGDEKMRQGYKDRGDMREIVGPVSHEKSFSNRAIVQWFFHSSFCSFHWPPSRSSVIVPFEFFSSRSSTSSVALSPSTAPRLTFTCFGCIA